MKRYFSLLTVTLLSAGLAFVSCVDPNSPEEQPKPETPVFPEAVTETLEAGGSYTVEFEPNMDWSMELKYEKESTGWFWIQDKHSQVDKVRGKAGEKAAVTVCTDERTDFDIAHTCTLVMTMGTEEKTVATFTRGTLTRTFSLAVCALESNGSDYVYNETEGSDLMYQYGEALSGEKPEIPLQWLIRTGDFRRSVLASGNFEWQLKSKPEWLLALRTSGGTAGEQVEFELEGDPMKYPLEDSTAEIVFCAADNADAVFTYTVSIPGCRDMFEISGFEAETKANVAGEIFQNGMLAEGTYLPAEQGLTGTVMGIEGVKLYTFVYYVENEFNSYWDDSAENTSWIQATLADWETGGNVLQSRSLNVTVAPNEGAQRKACILAIPAAVAPAESYSIFPDGQTMDEKYKDYVVMTLVQDAFEDSGEGGEGGEEPEITVEPITFRYAYAWEDMFGTPDIASLEQVTESNLEQLMTKYAKYDKLNISDYFGTTSATYVLAYYSNNQTMNQLSIPNMTTWLEITCHPKGEWLTYEPNENELSIWMTKPGASATQNFGIIQVFISMQRSYTIICLPEL